MRCLPVAARKHPRVVAAGSCAAHGVHRDCLVSLHHRQARKSPRARARPAAGGRYRSSCAAWSELTTCTSGVGRALRARGALCGCSVSDTGAGDARRSCGTHFPRTFSDIFGHFRMVSRTTRSARGRRHRWHCDHQRASGRAAGPSHHSRLPCVLVRPHSSNGTLHALLLMHARGFLRRACGAETSGHSVKAACGGAVSRRRCAARGVMSEQTGWSRTHHGIDTQRARQHYFSHAEVSFIAMISSCAVPVATLCSRGSHMGGVDIAQARLLARPGGTHRALRAYATKAPWRRGEPTTFCYYRRIPPSTLTQEQPERFPPREIGAIA